jgi:hypothetical protein
MIVVPITVVGAIFVVTPAMIIAVFWIVHAGASRTAGFDAAPRSRAAVIPRADCPQRRHVTVGALPAVVPLPLFLFREHLHTGSWRGAGADGV